MKNTKDDIKNAALFFAKKFGQKNNYELMILGGTTLPKLAEMIVYEMFIQEFNPYMSTDEEFEQYKLILEYCLELKEKGYVEFL